MENTIKKTSLRGKTHFDVPSSLWTKTMMLNYIKFQESYNDGWLILSEDSLMRFAYLHESSVKQQNLFSKVYKQFHDTHWKTMRNQKFILFNLECERIEGSGHEYIKKYLDKSK